MHISVPRRCALLTHNSKWLFIAFQLFTEWKIGENLRKRDLAYVNVLHFLLHEFTKENTWKIYQDNKSVLKIRTRLPPKCESVALPLDILPQSRLISHQLEVKDAMSDQCCLGLQKLILCPVKALQ